MTEKQMVRGTTDDLLQRYTLRVMLHAKEEQAFLAFNRWSDEDKPFIPSEAYRSIYDLSTVEELRNQMAIYQASIDIMAMADPGEDLDTMAALMYEAGVTLRQQFHQRYGYNIEDSTTPYTPVTIDGPVDHDTYFLREFGHI